MSAGGNIALIVQSCAAVVLVVAAIGDFRTFRIPNIFPALIIALFAVYAIVSPTPVGLIAHIASLILVFMAGLVVFHYKIMAGGDVKLIVSLALWFSIDQLHILLTIIALAGGVQAAIIILYHYVSLALRSLSVMRSEVCVENMSVRSPELRGRRVPYGVAIAGGSICAFLLTQS